jgi:recombination protein RecR
MRYPNHLLKLIDVLKKLPGVGSKSAERFAFQLLSWKLEHLNEMAAIIKDIPNKLIHCSTCLCLIGEDPCPFCNEKRQLSGNICIIGSSRDAFAIEETREYKGMYHVLGALLSPLDGIGPEKLHLQKLKERISTHRVSEILIALDSTLEGDATSLYIKRELEPMGVQISRLAFGLPMGSSLDYVDGGTLARALSGRSKF